MIKAAADTGDTAALKTTGDLAKKTNPHSAAEIDALLDSQAFFQRWKGQGQAGGSVTTGFVA